MRYRSLVDVNFILIDGRVEVKILQAIIDQTLIALTMHLNCHIVILCSSQEQAEAMDLLGERGGHELFFHGEIVDSVDEFQILLSASKLFVVPTTSLDLAFLTVQEHRLTVPLLLAASDHARFYAECSLSDHFMETTPLNCFLTVGQQNG